MADKDVSVIIVSWNGKDLLRKCLQSVYSSQGVSLEVLVVDNNSTDGTVEMIREDFPEVKLISNRDNKGFSYANNQALSKATGKYLFILNPDTVIERNTINKLSVFLMKNSSIGIAGPKITYEGGNLQYSCKSRFPNLRDAWFSQSLVMRFSPKKEVSDSMNMVVWDHAVVKEVAWVMGAAMFIRREVYDQIGGFDERFFMYFEDVDLCQRAKKRGWQVIYYPETVVTHFEGQSSAKIGSQKGVAAMQSAIRYYRKQSYLWGLIVWLMYLSTSLIYGLLLLVRGSQEAKETRDYNLNLFKRALTGWWNL
jgi:GT2 family glycosyltransferase